ncbi:MAG: DUF4384 domain-containing protein [Bryobacterales bacterium]|nr:DUF4384 domain-containing protein [Bryobacterales bacterium]
MPLFMSLPLLDGTLDCRAMGAAAIRWITLFGLVCFGQTPYKKAPPSPRDLFVNAESSAAPTSAPLSILYGLLRRQPDGTFAGVDPKAAVFHAGDRVRLRVQANQEAYVAVLQRGSSGTWGVLYPRAAASIDPLGAFEVCSIPDSTGSFAFDTTPGEERLVLIVSRTSVSARAIVDRLNQEPMEGQASPSPRRKGEDLVARDLVYQQVEDDKRSSFSGTAVYVADGAKDDAPLLVEILLRHLK